VERQRGEIPPQSQGEVSRINTEPTHSMISRKGARSPLGQKRVKGVCPAFLKSEYFTSYSSLVMTHFRVYIS